MENSRRCDICNINVHKASYAKHLWNKKKRLENRRQNDIITPEWLFKEEQALIKNKI